MSEDDTLISKLISETYLDQSDKDQPNSFVDLRNYFEKRLNEVDYLCINEYLIQNELAFVELKMQGQSQCYRLVLKKSVMDFPSNWSIFKEIKSQDLIYVDQSLDQDYLLDIFSELTGSQSNLALVKDENQVKLVFLPEEVSKEHIQWMRMFFEKKNQEQIKEAA